MTLKSDAKFKEEFTCGFKYGMRNLLNFQPTTQKSKNFTSMGYFCPKYMRFELTFIRGPKSLKIVHWCDLFVQSIYCFSEELCVMTLKGVAKFKRKLTCSLKNYIRNLVNFHASGWKTENLHFDWIRLSKAYIYLDEKVQKSYVSCHWRVTQSLKKNWLLVPKLTWEIWWFLMRALTSPEIFTLMYYLCQ